MKLLIVDDQSSVVNSMLEGIDWKSEGIDIVFAAYNTMEAKEILTQHQINIMLCDIEMPVENGLSLVRWIREQNMPTQCIMLTSYMEFDYAQQAIQLQTLDYIIQPAPFEKIKLAVQKAVQKIIALGVNSQLESYGKMLEKQKPIIESSQLYYYFMQKKLWEEKGDNQIYNLPSHNAKGYIILMELLCWDSGCAPWENSLVQIAASNIMAELFAGYAQNVWLCPLETNTWGILLSGENYIMDGDGVERQMRKFNEICKEHLHFQLACYIMGPKKICELSTLMPNLRAMQTDNVTRASLVFSNSINGDSEAKTPFFPQFKSWERLLLQGYTDTVKSQILSFLQDPKRQQDMNATALQSFFIQFTQAAAKEIEITFGLDREFVSGVEHYKVYRNADRSIENMITFVNSTLDLLKSNFTDYIQDTFNINKVIEYILQHLEDDLRRDELAQHFHVHPDHLTRAFKKRTGMALKEYICEKKMLLAQTLLQTTSLPVGFVAAKVGYSNFSHFSKSYCKIIGRLPSQEPRNYNLVHD